MMDDHIEALDSAPDSAGEVSPPHEPAGNGKVVVAEVAPGRNGAGRRGRASKVGASVEVPQPPADALPAEIDENDLQYHRMTVQEYNSAQAALSSWMRYAGMKYRLNQGDRIDEYGKIHRADPAQATGQTPVAPQR